MIRRILDTWLRVTEVKAEARVEAARIRAEAMLEIAQMQMPPPPEEVEPVETPEDIVKIETWARGRFKSEAQISDVVGMAEAVLGIIPASDEDRRHFRGRLAKLGAPI